MNNQDRSDQSISENFGRTNRARILFVDDERDITSIFKQGLQRKGFEVDAFTDPLEAVSHFKPRYYGLALIDVKMPRLSGPDLYKVLVAKDSELKVCFFTAFEIQSDKIMSDVPHEHRCAIKKPISLRDLVIEIEKLLAKPIPQ